MVLGVQENVDGLQVSMDHALVERRRGRRKGWRRRETRESGSSDKKCV